MLKETISMLHTYSEPSVYDSIVERWGKEVYGCFIALIYHRKWCSDNKTLFEGISAVLSEYNVWNRRTVENIKTYGMKGWFKEETLYSISLELF